VRIFPSDWMRPTGKRFAMPIANGESLPRRSTLFRTAAFLEPTECLPVPRVPAAEATTIRRTTPTVRRLI
jgi:hypothetical protein